MCTKVASRIVSAVWRHDSTKSRLGIVSLAASVTVTALGVPSSRVPGTAVWMIWCNSEVTSTKPGPPVSIVTVIETSWPALVGGLTGSGVMRPASGTSLVSAAKPVPEAAIEAASV